MKISFFGLMSAPAFAGLLTACGDLSDIPLQPSNVEPALQQVGSESVSDPHIIPGHYIIRFQDNVSDPGHLAHLLTQAAGGTLRHTYGHAISGFAAKLPAEAVQVLRRNPKVVSVTPDILGTVDGSPQNYPDWGLDRVDQHGRSLNNMYYYDDSGSGVDIYILDSGISQSHSEFTGRIKKFYVAISNSMSIEDCSGHGSSVASIAAGTSYGVAKAAWVIPVRINDCDGTITLSDAIEGIDWIKSDHSTNPAVANMSFSFPDYYYGEENLEDAVRALIGDGVTVVASAGNGDFYADPSGYTENADDACGQSPADIAEVITVSATDRNDRRPGWANYGDCVDIFAPGLEIKSAHTNGGSGLWSGTSQAAPFVTGTAALYLGQYPSASPAAVWTSILGSSTVGFVSNSRGSSNLLVYSRVPVHPSVLIRGPERVHPMDFCEWTASVKGGAPPFTYLWEGIGSGTGANYAFTPATSGYLYVYVTDAKNRGAEARIYVTVTNEQVPGCY